jgi:AcrR family transcriptional regulator
MVKFQNMDTMDQPAKPYLNHRENQRERILEVAEVLFIRNGIEKVNLSAIARAARLTRNTIYEYFPNKQEVAWAILQKIFTQPRTDFPDIQESSAIQRIEGFMLRMVSQLQKNPNHARFLVEFNSLYSREITSDRMRQITGRDKGDDYVLRLIEEGIADGSVRPDLDSALISAAIWNLLSGMNARFSLLGELIQEEYNQPVLTIYHEICRVFLRGMQSNTNSKEREG